MRHLVSILLENETGALARVVGLFAQRGYNIESITASPTDDPKISRMTISTLEDSENLEQVSKQIHKLINVITVDVLDECKNGYLSRELVLLKLKACDNETRDNIKRVNDIFKSEIVDISESSYTVEFTADSETIDRLVNAMKSQAQIIEIVRSGLCGISRGPFSI